MTEKAKKWSDANIATLTNNIGSVRPVAATTVAQLAKMLNVSERSVASKLRQLDIEVASMAKEKVPAFSTQEGDALTKFVGENSGAFTYGEIAERFAGGKFTAKQIQGKILALELTASVKPTEKVEAARTYTESEENTFISMANGGKFIEEIAAALNKTIASVRGKALSLTRKGQIEKIPAQKESHAKSTVDPVEALGTSIATMTVAEIAKVVDKTERGLKTLLTRRGIKVADYDGASKKERNEKKASA